MFRLATPVGQRLTDDESDASQAIEEPPVQRKKKALRPIRQSDEDEEPRSERPRRRKPLPPPSRAPQVVLAGVVFVCFVGLAVGAFFLVRHLAAPEKPAEPEVVVAPEPAPQPEPRPPETGQPEPPPVEPVRPAAPVILPLDGPVTALYTGGGGRFVVFHLSAPRQLVVYDVAAAKVISTINGIDQNVQVAVGREKVFVGRSSDGRLTRYDLRTGAQELTGGPKLPERLNHLAIGSNSDGPLVTGGNSTDNMYQARLYDAETLVPLDVAIDDPIRKDDRRFPFSQPVGASHVAVSADGRAICLSDRLYTRTTTGYKAVPINPSSGLRPGPDGKVALGNSLVGADGKVVRFTDRGARWLLPAANGPFFMSAEYGPGKPVRLMLHADQDQQPLGELPVGDLLAERFAKSTSGVSSLYRQLAFLPEPGLVVFVATGAREAHLVSVDLPGLLAKGGRDVMFTSVPPAAVPQNLRYAYTATAVSRDGAEPKFELESGPPGMTVTPNGQLSWSPDRSIPPGAVDVRLMARSGGKQTVQQFQLFVPLKR